MKLLWYTIIAFVMMSCSSEPPVNMDHILGGKPPVKEGEYIVRGSCYDGVIFEFTCPDGYERFVDCFYPIGEQGWCWKIKE